MKVQVLIKGHDIALKEIRLNEKGEQTCTNIAIEKVHERLDRPLARKIIVEPIVVSPDGSVKSFSDMTWDEFSCEYVKGTFHEDPSKSTGDV